MVQAGSMGALDQWEKSLVEEAATSSVLQADVDAPRVDAAVWSEQVVWNWSTTLYLCL